MPSHLNVGYLTSFYINLLLIVAICENLPPPLLCFSLRGQFCGVIWLLWPPQRRKIPGVSKSGTCPHPQLSVQLLQDLHVQSCHPPNLSG